MSFVAHENKITTSMIDSLWNLCHNSDYDVSLQTLRISAFDTIGAMAPFVSKKIMNYIGVKITSVSSPLSPSPSSLSLIDIPLLNFIGRIVKLNVHSATNEDNANKFGFYMIWDYILKKNNGNDAETACNIIGYVFMYSL